MTLVIGGHQQIDTFGSCSTLKAQQLHEIPRRSNPIPLCTLKNVLLVVYLVLTDWTIA